jgi:hypothetical protein
MSNLVNQPATLSIADQMVEALQTIDIIDVILYNSGLPGRTHERWAKIMFNTEKESAIDGFVNDNAMLTSMLASAKQNRVDLKTDLMLDNGEHIVIVVKKVNADHLTCLVEEHLRVRQAIWSAKERIISANTTAEPGRVVAKRVLGW